MIKKLLILFFFLGSFYMQAQGMVWKTNMNDAIVLGDEQKRPLLIYFTAAGMSARI